MTDPIVVGPNTTVVRISEDIKANRETIKSQVVVGEEVISKLVLEVKVVLTDLIATSQQIQQQATQLTITDDNDLTNANQFLVDLAQPIKRAEDYKDYCTKAIKKSSRDIDNQFKSIITPLETASTLIRSKTVAYRRQQQEDARIVADIIEQERIANTPKDQPLPPPMPQPIIPPTMSEQKSVRVDGGQVSYTKFWDFEIKDITLIPIELLRMVVNRKDGREVLESVIKSQIKAGIRNMEGIRIFENERPAVYGG